MKTFLTCAVLACTLLLVVSIAQLAEANYDMVSLRGELTDLQDEGRVLQAKHELIFDLEAIEKQLLADGTMVRGRAGQTVYLDLSEPDSVVYYDGAGKGLSALLHRADRKKCVLCGGYYLPKSNRAKYCPECAEQERRRKTRDRVRRHRAGM